MVIVAALFVLEYPLNSQTSIEFKEQLAQFYFEHDRDFADQDLTRLDQLIVQLERKRANKSSDLRFLKSLFYKTHNKLLIKYNKLASVDETIENGTYGCLTGTIIYALLLKHFDFDYRIIELPNHVFIQVKVDENIVFLESTMPSDGFIKQSDIRNSEKVPHQLKDINPLQIVSQQTNDFIEIQGYKSISLTELNALQHFNESVKLFNLGAYKESILHAVEAFNFYPTEKNKMLMQLVVNKIINHRELDQNQKNDLIGIYIQYKEKLDLGEIYASLTPASK